MMIYPLCLPDAVFDGHRKCVGWAKRSVPNERKYRELNVTGYV